MTSIDSIAPVHICADGIAFTCAISENLGFVRACVGPQNGVFVNIVGVGTVSAWVIGGETERVEVLEYGDDGVEVIVMGVGWCWEVGFDYLAGDGHRMGVLEVEFAGEIGQYCRGDVGPVICGVCGTIDVERDGIRSCCWLLESYLKHGY